jgi:acetyl-CoA carboxylase beta subunit
MRRTVKAVRTALWSRTRFGIAVMSGGACMREVIGA